MTVLLWRGEGKGPAIKEKLTFGEDPTAAHNFFFFCSLSYFIERYIVGISNANHNLTIRDMLFR